MARGRKRPRFVDKKDDEFVKDRIIKCSFSSLCLGKERNIRPLFKDAIVYCNQLRVLVSVVAKHHMFSLLESSHELGFEPDQNYYSRVKTIIVKGALLDGPKRPAPAYEASLRTSKDSVVSHFEAMPVYEGKLSITQIMAYQSKQLAENLKTHVEQHAFDCLRNWLNNQIRARLPQVEYDHKRVRGYIGKWVKTLSEMAPDLEIRYNDLLAELTTARETKKTSSLVEYMYRLRREVDALETSTGREMKLMAVVPQANIQLSTIKIDSVVAAYAYKLAYPDCDRKIESLAKDEDIWSDLFRMDKINKLRPKDKFGFSIQTDGVAAMVLFKSLAPNSEKPESAAARCKRKREETTRKKTSPLRPKPVTGPGLYGEDATLLPHLTGLVAVDPGVRTIITAVQLDAEGTRKPFQLGQKEYKDGTMMTYKNRKVGTGTYTYKRKMSRVQRIMTAAPSKKTVARYDEYIVALAATWTDSWAYHARLKLRKIKFFVYRRRESWMEKTTNRFRDYVAENQAAGQTPQVLFGDGGKDGQFGKLRGGGMKGPLLELKRRLSKKVAIVECSEYRTSKLCLECGCAARFYKHGVTFCDNQSHHRMQNRDVAAAFKIGARYLANAAGRDLGPWSRGSVVGSTSTVLRDALHTYQTGHTTLIS